MAARKKPQYRNWCYAPRKTDGYRCQRGIKPQDTHCFAHDSWLPRILNAADEPVYVPVYHDHLLRARTRPTVALSRFHRDLMSAVVHCVDNVDDRWFNDVGSCGNQMLGNKLWRKASSRKAMHRCEYIAGLAESSLDEELSGLMFRVFLQSIFPCAGFEETLVTELVTEFEGIESPAPRVGAARAMQLVGIHACLRHQRAPNPSQCPTARHVIQREGEDTFVNLLDQGARDWKGLADLAPT